MVKILFPNKSYDSFICRIAHSTACVTLVVEHWLKREVSAKINAQLQLEMIKFEGIIASSLFRYQIIGPYMIGLFDKAF